MTRHDPALAAKLYQPSAASLTKQLPGMGQCLATACIELEQHATPQGCGIVISQLRAAEQAISRLRQSLISEARKQS